MSDEVMLISRLQNWFNSECNGDWEHSYGFKLETLDNPGWTFEVDLIETQWSDVEITRQRVDRTESNWVQFEISQGRYMASGGVFNLAEMLMTFFDVLDRESDKSGFNCESQL